MIPRLLMLTLHALLGGAALVLAFLFRFDFRPLQEVYFDMMCIALPVSMALKVATAELFGLNHSVWRYASLGDLFRIARAGLIATLLMIPAMLILVGHGFPRGIYALDLVLTIALFSLPRLLTRHWVREDPLSIFRKPKGAPTLILGAGDAGELAFRQLRKKGATPHRMVGFLDDDPAKVGLSIHGHPILGTSRDAETVIAKWRIDVLVVAIRDPGRDLLERMSRICGERNVDLRILPTLQDLLTGEIQVKPVRPLRLEDLLEREPVRLDPAPVRRALRGKRILVTGAGGSIGAELCRQIAGVEPAHLCLLDHAENELFEIEQELRDTRPTLNLTAALIDIREPVALDRLFREHPPDVVFHAAACKHVPMMETHPFEAVRTNVFGTANLLHAARIHRASRFVLVSTDKAAAPANVMGATKWLAEQLVRAEGRNAGLAFSCVRFGNVLGSRGSVVPLFERQIARGGPVRVTHQDATRYFMTIPESVQLILQADAHAEPGDVFILDMGQPVSILSLAKNLIRLSGYRPDANMEIRIVGLRPGEKLHEQLASDAERLLDTPVPKLRRLDPDASAPAPPSPETLDTLRQALRQGDSTAFTKILWTLIPAS